jgi:hypothetical protein
MNGERDKRNLRVNKIFLQNLAQHDDSFMPYREYGIRAWMQRAWYVFLVLIFLLPPSFRIGISREVKPEIKTPAEVQAGALLQIPIDSRVEKMAIVGRPSITVPRLRSIVAPVGLTETVPVSLQILGKSFRPDQALAKLGLSPRVVGFSDIKLPIAKVDPEPNEPNPKANWRMVQAFGIFEDQVHRALSSWPELTEKTEEAARLDPIPQVTCWQMPLRLGSASDFGDARRPTKGEAYIHRGIDLRAPSGSQVRSAGPGKVLISQKYPGDLHTLVIHHGGALVSKFTALREVTLKPGDVVTSGMQIGLAGVANRWETPIVHFEIEWAGRVLNPRQFVDFTRKICK